MSGGDAEHRTHKPPARPSHTSSHFFVLSDGSSYEISVRGGCIHISGTSFAKYEEEGESKKEKVQGTELTVTYTSVLDQKHFKDTGGERKWILQTAEIQMDVINAAGERETWPFEIPATWPACMLPRGASERQQALLDAHNQLPALQAFFQHAVASGILRETPGWRSRNTLASDQIHTYTYSVIEMIERDVIEPPLRPGSSMPNPYLTTQIPKLPQMPELPELPVARPIDDLQSGVASSVLAAPRPAPHELALRSRHTRAPKRQPPRPPRPPSNTVDGLFDDREWDFSWRLVVRVGSAAGQWPRDSAQELVQEAVLGELEHDLDDHDRVLEEVMEQLESLLEPCSAQDAAWWARVRDSYKFESGNGALLGDRRQARSRHQARSNHQHLLFLYFYNNDSYNNDRRITLADWEAGRRDVTSVTIKYRGPARFRPRHPNGQQFTEYRVPTDEVSPVFGF